MTRTAVADCVTLGQQEIFGVRVIGILPIRLSDRVALRTVLGEVCRRMIRSFHGSISLRVAAAAIQR